MTSQTPRERMIDVVARELMRPEHCCDGTEKGCRDGCPRPAIEVFNADDLAGMVVSALAEAGLVGERIEALITAAEVVVLDAGDDATGPEPDPNLSELAYCLEQVNPGWKEVE